MYTRLVAHSEHNNILSNKQFGFRKHHFTYMALIKLLDRVSERIDSKKISIGIIIDLSKAFDTLNHEILIKKLNLYVVFVVQLIIGFVVISEIDFSLFKMIA